MKKLFFLALLTQLSLTQAQAQDERFFRRILSGDLIESEQGPPPKKTYHYVAQTPLYEVDLKKDAKPLGFSYEMKDGEHWIYLYDSPSGKKQIFKGKLETMGKEGNLFRVSLRDLAPTVRLMILYFYEGNSNYLELNSTARLYYLTMENNNLETLALNPGPFFFQEREAHKRGYFQRNYQIDLYDYNKDGIKEVVVKHGHSASVSMFLGKGRWKEF